MGRIVVGIDGSDHSKKALRWALDEARLRDASLDVVSAWMLPVYATGYGFAPGDLIDPKIIGDGAAAQLDEAVTEVVGDATDVDAHAEVGRGNGRPGARRGSRGSRLARRRLTRSRRLRRAAARVGQPAMCSACVVSGRDHSRPAGRSGELDVGLEDLPGERVADELGA